MIIILIDIIMEDGVYRLNVFYFASDCFTLLVNLVHVSYKCYLVYRVSMINSIVVKYICSRLMMMPAFHFGW